MKQSIKLVGLILTAIIVPFATLTASLKCKLSDGNALIYMGISIAYSLGALAAVIMIMNKANKEPEALLHEKEEPKPDNIQPKASVATLNETALAAAVIARKFQITIFSVPSVTFRHQVNEIIAELAVDYVTSEAKDKSLKVNTKEWAMDIHAYARKELVKRYALGTHANKI